MFCGKMYLIIRNKKTLLKANFILLRFLRIDFYRLKSKGQLLKKKNEFIILLLHNDIHENYV